MSTCGLRSIVFDFRVVLSVSQSGHVSTDLEVFRNSLWTIKYHAFQV